MIDPKWTVLYNIVSQESKQWIGTGWEFFNSESDAQICCLRHEQLGNVPTMRLFHQNDRIHLGAAHR